jgi:WD40 repeat protein
VAAGTPPNRRKMWLIVAIAVLVVAAVAVAAYFLFIRDSGDKTVAKPTPTPTLVSSPGATTTATAGPSPSASPSGTPVLAFVSGRKSDGISLANTDGTVAQLVPSTGSAITSPEWSPGGRYLAYIQGPYETAQLYVYDATTQRSAPFSFGGSPPAAVESFAWTGPAQLVAAGFTQRPRRFTENAVLWSCNVFLGTATTLKDSSGAVVTGRDISAAAGKLVFDVYTDRYREGPYSVQVTANLRLLDLQSGMVQTIASHSELEGYEFDYQEPLLSPDGSAVMFSSTGTDVSVTYEILGTDGSVIMAPKHLLFPSRYSWNPARPTQIAFAGRRQENGPTFIFRYDTASGGGPKVIANISGQILMDIAWSPDGKTVAYTLLDHQYNLDTGDLMAFSPGQLESARLAAPALYVTWGVSSYAAGGGTGTSPPPPLAPSASQTP